MRASYDALIDLFVSFENFVSRLSIYAEIPPTPALTSVLVKIIVELISTLALATKQVKQGRFSEFYSGCYYDQLNGAQKNSWGSFEERRISRRRSRGWIDSPWTRVGQLPLRPSKLSTVLSNIGWPSWMVRIPRIPSFLRWLPAVFIFLDADGNESATSISRTLGMFHDS
jgi:hypothetical protein